MKKTKFVVYFKNHHQTTVKCTNINEAVFRAIIYAYDNAFNPDIAKVVDEYSNSYTNITVDVGYVLFNPKEKWYL